MILFFVDLTARPLGNLDASEFSLDPTTGISIVSGGTATITLTANADAISEDLEVLEISIENAQIASGMTMTIFPWKARVFITDVPRTYIIKIDYFSSLLIFALLIYSLFLFTHKYDNIKSTILPRFKD